MITLFPIRSEQSSLAIIADVRFPNEVDAIRNAGGKVIRLPESFRATHLSENTDEDNYDWIILIMLSRTAQIFSLKR